MTSGVIYLLDGTKPAARLVVSLVTLRRHYEGPVAILATSATASEVVESICLDPSLSVALANIEHDLGDAKHRPFLLKTIVHRFSPFDVTLFLDCDTIVRGDLSPLFEFPTDEHILVTQFVNWTSDMRMIARRVQRWSSICPELIEPALEFGQAVNTGVFSFTRSTVAMKNWFALAYAGRHEFIPDEIAMQLLLPAVPAVVLDDRFNCSPKFRDAEGDDVRIVHFHGRKHVGSYGRLWLQEYDNVVARNTGGIRDWTPAGDRVLRDYLKSRAEVPA